MVNPYIDMYYQYYKMALDTGSVLNYRLPLLHSMASDNAVLWSPAKWFEVNRMIAEKMFAFSQAYILFATNIAQLLYGKLPSEGKILQVQRKTLQPIKTTLSANARRVRKKKISKK